jgi:hypothetical protein
VPDFFVVGHAKSGTTALYEMLRAHPQIFMPDFKEPMFFARNWDAPAHAADQPRRFDQTGRRSETLEDYLSLFEPAEPDQRVGEASTFYLWSALAPGRIAAARPDARIIAILREPASFIASLHMQMLQNQAESERDLLRAIALEPSRRAGRDIPAHAYWPEALMYTERVRYTEQLERYHAAFGRARVLTLIYDDFRAENEATVRQVLRFLDVDDTAPLRVVDANPSVRVRSMRLNTIVSDARQGHTAGARALRATVRTLTSERIRAAVLYPLRRRLLYGEVRGAEPEVMSELRSRFAPEVSRLSEYLGRDLISLWGYDSAA